MKLIVERIHFKETYTIGKLYIDFSNNFDPEYFCDTLEDKVRFDGKKVYGKTAIPDGTYKLLLTHSPKFKRILPLVQNVPGYSGVRIHAGNTEADTEGCILVGFNKMKGQIINSHLTFMKLFDLLKKYPEIDTIEIINKV